MAGFGGVSAQSMCEFAERIAIVKASTLGETVKIVRGRLIRSETTCIGGGEGSLCYIALTPSFSIPCFWREDSLRTPIHRLYSRYYPNMIECCDHHKTLTPMETPGSVRSNRRTAGALYPLCARVRSIPARVRSRPLPVGSSRQIIRAKTP